MILCAWLSPAFFHQILLDLLHDWLCLPTRVVAGFPFVCSSVLICLGWLL